RRLGIGEVDARLAPPRLGGGDALGEGGGGAVHSRATSLDLSHGWYQARAHADPPPRADLMSERESMPVDVVIVGAGPAGLAAAIRLKQLEPALEVVVLEKG